jgi:hypothetical protein
MKAGYFIKFAFIFFILLGLSLFISTMAADNYFFRISSPSLTFQAACFTILPLHKAAVGGRKPFSNGSTVR